MLQCQGNNIPCNIGVFPKWKGNAVNSAKLIYYCNINWGHFKNPFYYLCLTGAMVTSRYLIQEVASLNNLL